MIDSFGYQEVWGALIHLPLPQPFSKTPNPLFQGLVLLAKAKTNQFSALTTIFPEAGARDSRNPGLLGEHSAELKIILESQWANIYQNIVGALRGVHFKSKFVQGAA
jgi:hypothetical protein